MKQVICQNGEESVDNDGTQKEPLNLQKHGGIQSMVIYEKLHITEFQNILIWWMKYYRNDIQWLRIVAQPVNIEWITEKMQYWIDTIFEETATDMQLI